MSARFLATFCLVTTCLLTASMSLARAGSPTGGSAPVFLRLRSGAVPSATLEELQNEVSGLMNTTGVAVEWQDPNTYRDVSGATVVVDLEGDCSAPFHGDTAPVAEGAAIGSTAIADNHLLPFVNVNCNVLTGLIAPFIGDRPKVFREYVFGRALGRVLAHELYHIVAQSEDHGDSGVAKASFSAVDLLKDQFEFDELAVNRIHTAEISNSAPAISDSESGAGFANEDSESK